MVWVLGWAVIFSYELGYIKFLEISFLLYKSEGIRKEYEPLHLCYSLSSLKAELILLKENVFKNYFVVWY